MIGYIIDSGIFMNISQVKEVLRGSMFTTSLVYEEIKSLLPKLQLASQTAKNKLEILDPSMKHINHVTKSTIQFGETSLSQADISLISLAFELEDLGVKSILISDDFALRNLAQKLGVNTKGFKTSKRSFRIRTYQYYCKACHSVNPNNESCEVCGHTKFKKIWKT